MPEFEGKCSHARAIYRERQRASARIDADRLAVPPCGALAELQQLGLWNKWVRYEMTNPDNLGPAQVPPVQPPIQPLSTPYLPPI